MSSVMGAPFVDLKKTPVVFFAVCRAKFTKLIMRVQKRSQFATPFYTFDDSLLHSAVIHDQVAYAQ